MPELIRAYMSVLYGRLVELRRDERGSVSAEQVVITGGLVLLAAALVAAVGPKVTEKIGSINL